MAKKATGRSTRRPKPVVAPAPEPAVEELPAEDQASIVADEPSPAVGDQVAVADGPIEPKVPEAPIEAPGGYQLVRYTGHADVLSHRDMRFRPGVWVRVPVDTAEELLTLPFEAFEGKMEAEGDDG